MTAVVHSIIVSTPNPCLHLHRPYSKTRFGHFHCCTPVRFQEEGAAAVSWCLGRRYYSSVMVSAVGQCQSLLAPNRCGCLCVWFCCSHLDSNVLFRQQSSTLPPLRLKKQISLVSSIQAIHRPDVSASKSQTSVDINSPHVSVVGVIYYFI